MNQEASLRQIRASELKAMRDQGLPHEPFDVRTTAERALFAEVPAGGS